MHEFDVIHMHVSYSHGVCLCICFSFLFKLPISLGSNSEGWHQELEKLLMWDLMHRHLKLMLCYYFLIFFPPLFWIYRKNSGAGSQTSVFFNYQTYQIIFKKWFCGEVFVGKNIYSVYCPQGQFITCFKSLGLWFAFQMLMMQFYGSTPRQQRDTRETWGIKPRSASSTRRWASVWPCSMHNNKSLM